MRIQQTEVYWTTFIKAVWVGKLQNLFSIMTKLAIFLLAVVAVGVVKSALVIDGVRIDERPKAVFAKMVAPLRKGLQAVKSKIKPTYVMYVAEYTNFVKAFKIPKIFSYLFPGKLYMVFFVDKKVEKLHWFVLETDGIEVYNTKAYGKEKTLDEKDEPYQITFALLQALLKGGKIDAARELVNKAVMLVMRSEKQIKRLKNQVTKHLKSMTET